MFDFSILFPPFPSISSNPDTHTHCGTTYALFGGPINNGGQNIVAGIADGFFLFKAKPPQQKIYIAKYNLSTASKSETADVP